MNGWCPVAISTACVARSAWKRCNPIDVLRSSPQTMYVESVPRHPSALVGVMNAPAACAVTRCQARCWVASSASCRNRAPNEAGS
jgi:hypothetical protein